MVGIIVLQIVLIILNAIFSSAEISVISMNETKIKQMAEEGDRRAEKAVLLLEKPAKFLEAIQAAVTFAGLLSGAFVAVYFAELAKSAVMEVFAGKMIASEQVIYGVSVIVVTLILTYVNLLFGEILPKRAAMSKSEDDAFKMIGILFLVAKLFAPLAGLLHISSNIFLRMIGINPEEEQEVVTEEEIRMMLAEGKEQGTIQKEESKMIQNVFEFNDTTAEQVSTRRRDLVCLNLEDDAQEWEKTIRECRFSHFPIIDSNQEDVVGILDTKDYFRSEDKSKEYVMKNAVDDPYFVPEQITADVLFKDMQSRKIRFAIVINEFGEVSGIVTMEDLLEEIVGNIYDEYDHQELPEIMKISPHKWKVSGNIDIEDLLEEIPLPVDINDSYDTLGGLVLYLLGSIPKDGARFRLECGNYILHVIGVKNHRIQEVIIEETFPQHTKDEQEKDGD